MNEPRASRFQRVTILLPRVLLAAAFLTVPLLFYATDKEYTGLVYAVPKETGWAVLLAAAVCLWPFFRRARRDWASFSLSLLLLGVWVSCFRAVNIGYALLGSFAASFLVLLPLLAARVFPTDRARRLAAVSTLSGAGLVVIYALLQRMGWNPVLSTIVGLSDRYLLGSSLGSPQAVAIFAGILLPVAVGLSLTVPRDGRLALLLLVALSALGCLFLGGSRAAFVVALAGAVYLALLTLRGGRLSEVWRNRSGTPLVIGILILVLILGIAAVRPAGNDPAEVAPGVRKSAGELIADNALLGVGSNHWDIVFPLFHERDYSREVVRRTGPPPPTLYRIWGEWGVLGFLGFVGFGLWVLSAPFLPGGQRPAWTVCFAAGFAGVFVTSFWLNPLSQPGLRFFSWTLAALSYMGTASVEPRRVSSAGRVYLRTVTAAVCLAIAVFSLTELSLRPYMASRHYLQARFWQGLDKARIAYQRAIQLVPFHPYFWADYAENRVRVATNRDRQSEGFDQFAIQAQSVARRALRYLPSEPALIFRYATALDLQYGQPWEKMILYERAVSLSPNTAAFHVNLGITYMSLSGTISDRPAVAALLGERAVREWKTALDLDPSNLSAAYNLAEYARVHQDTEEILYYARLILKMHPNNRKALQLLQSLGVQVDDLESQRQLTALAQHWENQIERDPTDPSNYYRAGLIYEAMGDEERATAYYSEAFIRNPDYTPAVRKLRERNISLDRLLREGHPPLER